mmetsp:Transcript_6839/g.19345  ORF Transcript_6839/g.19345 Transcript_6839/m.19345 type:complete len:380 (-) Transcript_6839:119-1258(-)
MSGLVGLSSLVQSLRGKLNDAGGNISLQSKDAPCSKTSGPARAAVQEGEYGMLQQRTESYSAAAAGACSAACVLAREVLRVPSPPDDLSVAISQLQAATTTAAVHQQAALRSLVPAGYKLQTCAEAASSERLLFDFTGLSAEMDQLQRQHQEQQRQQQQQAVREFFVRVAAVQKDFLQSLSYALDEAIRATSPEPALQVQEQHLPDLAETLPAEVPEPKAQTQDLPEFDDMLPQAVPLPAHCSDVHASGVSFAEGMPPSPSDERVAEVDSPLLGFAATEDIRPEFPPPNPEDDEPSIAARLQEWQRGKGLLTLLASLHEIAPPGTWKERKLGDLLDADRARSAYRQALRTFHPDKLPQHKVLGQGLVDALVKANNEHKA